MAHGARRMNLQAQRDLAGPVVSDSSRRHRLVLRETRPPSARPARTSPSTRPSRSDRPSCRPSDLPLSNSSTASQFVYAITRIVSPSLPRPVPVRQHVHERLAREERLVQVERVLREAAGVENAPVRADARPPVRRRLAAVVEAGPGEQAGDERRRDATRHVSPRRLRPEAVSSSYDAKVNLRRIGLVRAARREHASASPPRSAACVGCLAWYGSYVRAGS